MIPKKTLPRNQRTRSKNLSALTLDSWSNTSEPLSSPIPAIARPVNLRLYSPRSFLSCTMCFQFQRARLSQSLFVIAAKPSILNLFHTRPALSERTQCLLVASCSSRSPPFAPPRYADPQATRDDIEISRILNVPRGTVRIAKDPRVPTRSTPCDKTVRSNRIDLATAKRVTHAGILHEMITASAAALRALPLGRTARFTLASNRRGPRDSGHFALARGILLDADTGVSGNGNNSTQTICPADVPIDDILAATSLGRDPTTDIRYAHQAQRRHHPSYLRARCTQPPITASVARAPCSSTLRWHLLRPQTHRPIQLQHRHHHQRRSRSK